MTLKKFVARFLVPAPFVSLYYFLKFGCMVSTRAEVEVSSKLKIGKKTVIGSFTKIKASEGPVCIGKDCSVSNSCTISGGEQGVRLGDDCLVGPRVAIHGSNYLYDDLKTPMRLQGKTSLGINIGDDVWLGAGAVVLDGATIGNGVIVTPNSVVSGHVPDNSIVQGDPARVIFRRR